jgi:thiol-disulfide isomerase/thioredoxin
VHRSFLVFGIAFMTLMAGALFYAARLPVEEPQAGASTAAPAPVPAMTLGVVSHPSFVLPDIDGVRHDLSEWSGKYRLLNFWATWCAPCRREIPLLKAFQAAQGDNGFQVLGIAVDFQDDVAEYAQKAAFNYPVLVGQEDAMAVAESSGIEFIGMPFTMIVSADGELLNAHLGEIHQQDLDRVVAVLGRLDRGEIDNAGARKELASL